MHEWEKTGWQTYALQISQDVLRDAKLVELGFYGSDNIVDDRAIDIGLNKWKKTDTRCQNLDRLLEQKTVSSSPLSYSTLSQNWYIAVSERHWSTPFTGA